MKYSVSSTTPQRTQQRQPARHVSRRGSMMLWTVWVFLAMLVVVAGLFNVMWLFCVRSEAHRQAESAVIVGGHAFLSDDLLRIQQQPFENDGRAARCRNATVDYVCQCGDSTLRQIISPGDVELVESLAETSPAVPEQVRLTFGKEQPNDRLRMFFSGLTGVQHARIGVSASARIEHSPKAFLPGGNATIPVLPFAIIDQAQSGASTLKSGGLWSQEIESGRGSDNLSWNPEQRSVENGPDGLPEITLTISPGSSGNKSDSFVPLRFAAASRVGTTSQTVNWMRHGVSAEDLKSLGLSQLSFPSTISMLSLSSIECAEIGALLQSQTGQSFIVCLSGDQFSAANSGTLRRQTTRRRSCNSFVRSLPESWLLRLMLAASFVFGCNPAS
jgi:hypothetical protein